MTQIETTKTTGFGRSVGMRSTTEKSLPEPINNNLVPFLGCHGPLFEKKNFAIGIPFLAIFETSCLLSSINNLGISIGVLKGSCGNFTTWA